MRMRQLARAAALSSGAKTRLGTRLEDRGLLMRILDDDCCRGFTTELIDCGWKLFAAAGPTHGQVLEAATPDASEVPDLRPLVTALHSEAVHA